MATIKFWQEMQKVVTIDGQDKLMIGKNSTGEAMYVNMEDINQFLSIVGTAVKPIPGGATEATAVILQPNAVGQTREMNNVTGWFKNPTGPAWEAPENSINTNWWDGTVWSLGSSIIIPVDTGTNVVIEGGVELVNQDGVFNAVKKVDDKFSQIVEDQDNLTPVFVPTAGGTPEFESGTYSGLGTNYGIINNFDFIRIFYKNLESLGLLKVTTLKFRICETDRNGLELATGQVAVNFASGASGYIDAGLNKVIENLNNSNIWLEFWGNGNMAYYPTIETVSSRKLRYRTTSQDFNLNFAQVSNETVQSYTKLPDVKFYLNNVELSPNKEFSDEVLLKGDATEEVEISNNKAVSGAGVKKAIKPFDDLIELDFIEESSSAIAGVTVVTNNPDIVGWAQLMGIQSNFNILKFPFRPINALKPPTYVNMKIRAGGNNGAILKDVTINESFQIGITKDLFFDLGSVFENVDNHNLFVQYQSDGVFACIGSSSGQQYPLYYTTNKTNPVFPSISVAQNVLRTEFILGSEQGVFTESAKEQITEIAGGSVSKDPDFLMTPTVWLYPLSQFNIYSKNLCIPKYGDNLDNYRLDFDGSAGKQLNRGYRIDNVPVSLNSDLSCTISFKGKDIINAVQKLLSTTANNGSGVTREVLEVGDSTIDNSNVATPLKAVFDEDVMNINLIGTRGAAGVKHEGKNGISWNDIYGLGRITYEVHFTSLINNPAINSVYSQGGTNYTVIELNISNGYFSVTQTSNTGVPRPLTATGSLTRVAGVGDATIAYNSVVNNPSNDFANPATEKFDIGYYLTKTSQTLSSGDWIFFQLGINDMFTTSSLVDGINRVNTIMPKIQYIIDNIRSYNADIRIGLVVTIPPADQDAWGDDYSLGQTSEKYRKLGLVELQKRMIQVYGNSASVNNKIYLVSAHLNLDVDYNFPTSDVPVNSRNSTVIKMQNNGVHPAPSGYAQIADMYAGLIKYFG